MFSFWNNWFYHTRWADDTEELTKNYDNSEKKICKIFNADLSLVENDSKLLKNTAHQLSEAAMELSTLLERKLQLAEKKFNLVENYIDDIVIVKTANKRVININDFACEIFGVERDLCVGKTIEELILEYPKLTDVLKTFAENENKSLETNVPVNFEIYVNYDDCDILLDVSVNPVESEDAKERELIIVGHNKEKIKQYNPSDMLFNSMPIPIVALTTDFKIYFVNKKLQEKFNISYKDVKKKPLSSLLPRELASKVIERIKETPLEETKINKSIKCTPIVEGDSVKFYLLRIN